MKPAPIRILRSLFLALLPLSAAAAAHAGENWFVFSIGDTPVGYVSERLSDQNGSRLTETSLAAALNRLGSKVEMRFDTSFRESAAGELEWLRSDVKLSQQTIRVEAMVEPERIRVLSSSAPDAPAHERLIERGGERLLGPEAIRQLSLTRLKQPGDVADYTVFSPELQRIAAVRRTVQAVGAVAPCAGDIATIQIDETIAGMPAARTLWLDPQGALVQDSIAGPFGPMSSCRSTREAALAATGGGSLPDEMYRRTIVRSNVRLADPAAVDRLLVRVRALDAARPLPELARHNQTVRAEGGAMLVEIRRPAAGSGGGKATAQPAAETLQPNALVESADPELVSLARSIVGEERDAHRAALLLSAWVAEHLALDLGVVMAPSTELLRDRRATCVGYATLLAALARASGLPARIAMGLVYYGGIWGGHAWTEIWIGDRWLPYDAAVYAPEVASATRLAAGASSFQDGGGELTARLGQLYGNVAIEIIEVETAGRTVAIPAGRAAYEIAGSSYANPGLGLAIDAPGWTIEDADSVWPSTLLVAFRRGEQRIELHELPLAPAGRAAAAMTKALSKGQAVFAVPAGGTLWLYSAAGPGSREELRDFLDRVRTTT